MTDQKSDNNNANDFEKDEQISDFDALLEQDISNDFFGNETSSFDEGENESGFPFESDAKEGEDLFSHSELPLEDQLAAEENLGAFGNETSETRFEDTAAFSLADEENMPEWATLESTDSDSDVSAAREDEFVPIIAPANISKESDFSSGEQAVQGSGSGFANILGSVAIVVAAAVVWLNMGLSERISELESLSDTELSQGLSSGLEVKALRQQIKASEQQRVQQIQAIEQQIKASEQRHNQQTRTHKQNINSLSKKLNDLTKQVERLIASRKSMPAKTVIKPAVTPARVIHQPASPAVKAAPAAAPAGKKKDKAEKFDPFKPLPSAAVAPVTTPAKKGNYAIILRSVGSEGAAAKELARIRAMGVNVDSVPVQIKGRTWYRIRATGFEDRKAAQDQKELLSKKLGIPDLWISKQ